MKKKFKKRYVVFTLILVVIVWGAISMGKGPAMIQVDSTNVALANIESTISAAGVVNASSTKEVYVTSSVKVNKLYVDKNDTVTAGQKIADFDLDDLNSSLKQAKINKEIQELNYQKLLVKTDDISANLIQRENMADTAKQNYENSLALYELGAISKIELENAEKSYKEASAGLNLATVSNDSDTEILKRQMEVSQLQINTLEKQLKILNDGMVSPIDGVIGVLNLVEGGYTAPSMPIYKVINTGEYEITANVKEFTAKDVKTGQQVYITGDAFDGTTYNGYVKSISPVASKTASAMGSQTFIEIIVGVSDENAELLTDGLNVTCDIVVDKKENVLSVPLSAFKEDKDGNKYVYAIENGVLKQVFVQTGINSEDRLEIISGIAEGSNIADNIGTSHKDGMKVATKV